MAHGTGLYWIRNYKADIETDEYFAVFSRLYNYFYPMMSDCVEPSCVAEDKFDVTISRWRRNRYNQLVADHLSETIRITDITKEESNKIWWNLKHRSISFETCREYFIELSQSNSSFRYIDEH